MDKCYNGILAHAMPFGELEKSAQDSGTKAKYAMAAGLGFLAVIAVVTFVMLGIVYCGLGCCFVLYIVLALPYGFGVLTLLLFKQMTSVFNVAMDWLSVALLSWNIVATGE